MSAGASSDIFFLSAGIQVVPALLWAILCERFWWILRTRKPRGTIYRLLPVVSGAVALHYAFDLLTIALPAEPGATSFVSQAVFGIREIMLLVAVTVGRHMVRFLPIPEQPPSRLWMLVNYGPAAVLSVLTFSHPTVLPALSAALPLLPTLDAQQARFLYFVLIEGYIIGTLLLGVVEAARIARRGLSSYVGLTSIRWPDVVLFGAAILIVLLFAAAFLHVGEAGGTVRPLGFFLAITNSLVGVLMAAPLALRMLGEVLRTFLVAAGVIAAVAVVFFIGLALSARVEPEYRLLIEVTTLLALLLVAGPVQHWLRDAVERLGFRRARRRESELHATLHTLSPELGAVACCERALMAFVRVLQARGAAILLADDDRTIAHGTIDLATLRRVWPHHAAIERFPRAGFGLLEMRELPASLHEPLIAARIVGVFPIASPRQVWGHLFLAAGVLGTVVTDDDGRVIHSFTDQLALILDGTELLERTAAVERSLAHAEKLSAIGELAARVAHEIRNPVTAARSLAQMIVRQPTSPWSAEHAELILTELERVERQVQALLRFARREDLRLEHIDLGELVHETVGDLAARHDDGRPEVEFEVQAPPGIVALADREKIRQVLINVIENAFDAVAETEGERAITIALSRQRDRAHLEVSDSGEGLPSEQMGRIFEPFFSLKSHGTGLGLAIVKRTVEAHGGRVAAHTNPRAGLTLRIDLPLAQSAKPMSSSMETRAARPVSAT